MEQKSFGKLADGEGATLYTISNTKGMCAQITDFGAAIVSLVVKDKNGKDTDVVLGYEDAQTYQQQVLEQSSEETAIVLQMLRL